MDNAKPKLRQIPGRFGWVNQGHWTEQHDPFVRLPEVTDKRPLTCPTSIT